MLKDIGIRPDCYIGRDEETNKEIKFPTEEEFWEAKREEENNESND